MSAADKLVFDVANSLVTRKTSFSARTTARRDARRNPSMRFGVARAGYALQS